MPRAKNPLRGVPSSALARQPSPINAGRSTVSGSSASSSLANIKLSASRRMSKRQSTGCNPIHTGLRLFNGYTRTEAPNDLQPIAEFVAANTLIRPENLG